MKFPAPYDFDKIEDMFNLRRYISIFNRDVQTLASKGISFRDNIQGQFIDVELDLTGFVAPSFFIRKISHNLNYVPNGWILVKNNIFTPDALVSVNSETWTSNNFDLIFNSKVSLSPIKAVKATIFIF